MRGIPSRGRVASAPSSRRPSARRASWRWSGPGRAARATCPAAEPREQGLEHAPAPRAACRGRCPDLEMRDLARVAQAEATRPSRVNFTALPSRLMRIWRSRFVGAHQLGRARVDLGGEDDAPALRLQLETAARSAAVSRSRIGARSRRSLPASMRASSVPSMSDSRWSPPRLMTRTAWFAAPGNGGVVVEQLRVAEDAVQRRAQLVADGRDVARLGLVGGSANAWPAAARGRCGGAIRSPHQQLRLAVRFLLRHLGALCA